MLTANSYPLTATMEYVLHLLILIGIFSILALSLNYVAGFTGILSLSHATFYGIGAYSLAILTTQSGWTFLPALLAGLLITGLIAWFVSFPLLRMKGDAFILVSLGFCLIGFNIMLNWTDLTNGPLGIKGIRAPTILGFSFFEKPYFLGLLLLALIGTYLFFAHIARSPYAVIIKSIRENPLVASVNGHAVTRYQRSVFVAGAIFAGLAGVFAAPFLAFLEPKLFTLLPTSIFILITVILGGMGSLKGSLLGAAILVLIPELLRFVGFPHTIIGELQQIIYGLILILLMFFRPQGLLGEYKI